MITCECGIIAEWRLNIREAFVLRHPPCCPWVSKELFHFSSMSLWLNSVLTEIK